MENNVLNDVGEEDDEEDNFVPDDEDEDEEDEEEESDDEEEEDVNAARQNDGVLEGGVAEPPPETGKLRRLASQADIVRTNRTKGRTQMFFLFIGMVDPNETNFYPLLVAINFKMIPRLYFLRAQNCCQVTPITPY
jgi:hypothetical protein